MNLKLVLGLISLLLCFLNGVHGQGKNGVTDYVNTFIGTAPLTDPAFIGYTPPVNWRVWAGLTYPGASLPNAMVQVSPITEYRTGAGYQYEDSVIYGFAHTNKGHWNLCHLPVLPVTGGMPEPEGFSSGFTHENESSTAGYYQVYLRDYDVNAELTSTLHTAFHRYSFKAEGPRGIVFALSKSNHRVQNWSIEQIDEHSVQGFQDMGRERIYFYATTDQPITGLVSTDEKKDGHTMLEFGDSPSQINMTVALSFVSTENARKNWESEARGKNFEQIRDAATETWESLLGKIKVKGGTEKERELFYSSLYRSFLWPALRSDVNGDFTDIKGEVQNKGFNFYTTPSLWDTFRNKLVLLSMLSPDVTTDVIKSMQDIGEATGFIPTFFHGDHAAPFITGTYLRGNHDFDIKKNYALLLNNATKEGGTREHIIEYIEKGYISTPQIDNPHVETKAKAGVSKTLEYAYDDYALSLLADALGDTETARTMEVRSQNYKNVFDTKTNFMRGRLANGDWVSPFDPQYPYYEYMYREANAWQLSFFAPHDMPGLVDLYGGPAAFESKLDSLFTVPWNPQHIARNVSSFIGQYCHGNQPDHEAPFSYYFIDKPEKSQEIINRILSDFYGVGEDGLALSGMDDAGEMSAWYVFGAAGIYPFSPASTEFIVTVPVFDEVEWNIGKQPFRFTRSGKGMKLQSIESDGKKIPGYFIDYKLMQDGKHVNVNTGE